MSFTNKQETWLTETELRPAAKNAETTDTGSGKK